MTMTPIPLQSPVAGAPGAPVQIGPGGDPSAAPEFAALLEGIGAALAISGPVADSAPPITALPTPAPGTAPVDPAAADTAPGASAPTVPVPTDRVPRDPVPTSPALSGPAPSGPALGSPAPGSPALGSPALAGPAPTDVAPAAAASPEPALVGPGATDADPADPITSPGPKAPRRTGDCRDGTTPAALFPSLPSSPTLTPTPPLPGEAAASALGIPASTSAVDPAVGIRAAVPAMNSAAPQAGRPAEPLPVIDPRRPALQTQPDLDASATAATPELPTTDPGRRTDIGDDTDPLQPATAPTTGTDASQPTPAAFAGPQARPAETAPASLSPTNSAALHHAVRVVAASTETAPTVSHVVLRVDPPGMGTIALRLVNHDGEITVAIRTDTGTAANALTATREELGRALATHGINLADVRVTTGAPHSDNAGGQPGGSWDGGGGPGEQRAPRDSDPWVDGGNSAAPAVDPPLNDKTAAVTRPPREGTWL